MLGIAGDTSAPTYGDDDNRLYGDSFSVATSGGTVDGDGVAYVLLADTTAVHAADNFLFGDVRDVATLNDSLVTGDVIGGNDELTAGYAGQSNRLTGDSYNVATSFGKVSGDVIGGDDDLTTGNASR